MQRITRTEFESRFPRRRPVDRLDGIVRDPIRIERDTDVAGVIEAPLTIDGAAHVIVTGVVEGPITVGPDAVLWCEPGLVEGAITVHGAAYLTATVGRVRGERQATIYDPCGPADSETG